MKKTSIYKSVMIGSTVLAGVTMKAQALDATDTMSVDATVTAGCSINAAASLNLGTYDTAAQASTALDSTGTIEVQCVTGTAATVKIDQGANAGAGSTDAAPARRTTDGTNYLSYALYQNVARTTVWGNTAGTSASHTGTGGDVTLTVYAQVPAGQTPPAGDYADTVTATISW